MEERQLVVTEQWSEKTKINTSVNDFKHIYRFLVYLMAVSLLKAVFIAFELDTFQSIFSYSNVILAMLVVFYYLLKKRIKFDWEICVSLIILLTSFAFTMISRSISSSFLAVGINIFLIYTSVVARHCYVSEKQFCVLCKIVLWFALLIVFIALVKDNPFSQLSSLRNAYNFTFFGIWNGKNQFGRFLVCATACNFYVILYYRNKRSQRPFYYFSLSVFLLCIVISFSRASLVALLTFFSLYFLFTSRHKFLRNFLILTAILSLFFVLYQNATIRHFVDSIVIRADTATIDSRSFLWNIGLDYFKDHLIVGSGEYMASEILKDGGSSITEFHNAYINRFVVSGLIVSLLYALLYIERFVSFFRARKKNGYTVLSFCLLSSFMVYMFFESFELFTLSLDSFIVMLFIYLIPNMKEKNEDGLSINKRNHSRI